MDLGLENKVAFITGGGQGIGRAVALGLSEEGARVVIAQRNEARGEAAAQEIRDKGGQALFVRVDVSKWPEVQQGVEETLKKYGQIDILINNAAAWGNKSFVHMPREEWDDQINVTLIGTLNCCKAVIDHMISRKSGAIINVGSNAGRAGVANQSIYSAAKGGQISFTRALATEVGKHNIRVNVVSPALTIVERRTQAEDRMKQEDPEKYAVYRKQMEGLMLAHPLRKFATADDLANMIVFLASDLRAGDITGQIISVDGGLYGSTPPAGRIQAIEKSN